MSYASPRQVLCNAYAANVQFSTIALAFSLCSCREDFLIKKSREYLRI